jgi:hypothetical protein
MQLVLAGVNISVSSNGEQNIQMMSLTNSDFVNSSSELAYDNYEITIYADSTKLTNGTVTKNVNNILSERYNLIWLAIMILIVILAYNWIKNT